MLCLFLRSSFCMQHCIKTISSFQCGSLFTLTERVQQEGRQFNMTFIFSNHRRHLISPQRLMKTN